MTEKTTYTNQPEVLTVEDGHADGRFLYTIAVNIAELPDGAGWEADVAKFWEYQGVLDHAAILASPETFLDYIPTWQRKEVEEQYTDAVQKWMDITAQVRGYDDIKSAVGYENSDDPTFKAEACALRSWRDKVWRACYTYMDSVLAGEETLVSPDALLARLPQMEWPE